MAKSARERKADQVHRDRIKGFVYRSIKIRKEKFDSIKKISKAKNETISSVFGEMIAQFLKHQKDEINPNCSSNHTQFK